VINSLVPPTTRVLVVDDEPGLREMLTILFRREGYYVVSAAGHNTALEAIARSPQPFPVVLTDLAMPDGSGLDVLSAAKSRDVSTEVILITAHSTLENAIEAMRLGAYDFVTKPFQPSELAALVAKALEKQALVQENLRLRAQVSYQSDTRIVAKSPRMRTMLELARRIAPAKTTVLITGASGTGLSNSRYTTGYSRPNTDHARTKRSKPRWWRGIAQASRTNQMPDPVNHSMNTAGAASFHQAQLPQKNNPPMPVNAA
jgi:two-component system response regulator PilR (NtrC family)